MPIDRVVRARRVVTPEGVRPAAVVIEEGRIRALAAWDEPPAGAPLEDWGELALLPGFVDSHVHLNEPGRTEWEGFRSATRAAAAGGVTTLVDMPLNSIPATTDAAALELKRRAAAGRLAVDVGLWGGAVPGNAGELAALDAGGVLGFKAFLAPSGVPEFGHVDERELEAAAREIARLGSRLLVHAEAPEVLDRALPPTGADPRRYATWLASRPVEAEVEAIELVARVAAATGARAHVVHVSSGAGAEAVRRARAAGVPITAETCPHYLTFAAEEIADGATEWKCAPPIRGRAEREALWRALAAGTLDLVASDHSPSPPAMKWSAGGDLLVAWGGIASLQVAPAATWTGAVARGFGLDRLARWLAAAPAELAGLERRKGALAPGFDADLVVLDPEAGFTVDAETLYHRHPVTPYAGLRLRGVVRATYLRGVKVHAEGELLGPPRGELLARAGRSVGGGR